MWLYILLVTSAATCGRRSVAWWACAVTTGDHSPEQNKQDVPASLTVISGDDIARRRLQDLNEWPVKRCIAIFIPFLTVFTSYWIYVENTTYYDCCFSDWCCCVSSLKHLREKPFFMLQNRNIKGKSRWMCYKIETVEEFRSVANFEFLEFWEFWVY